MPCDWTVVILEQAALDPERPPVVRQRAVSKIRRLLIEAIWRGYGGISKREVIAKSRDARRAVASLPTHAPDTQRDIDDLASHLTQAIADGYFGTLPVDVPQGAADLESSRCRNPEFPSGERSENQRSPS